MDDIVQAWQCEEWEDNFFINDPNCCRYNRGDWRCNGWWDDNGELFGDIGQGSYF